MGYVILVLLAFLTLIVYTLVVPNCNANQEVVDGKCVPKCVSGQIRSGNLCINPTKATSQVNCKTGEELVGNECLIKCEDGKVRQGNICVMLTPCTSSQELVGSRCLAKCADGEIREGDICKVKIQPCSSSQERINGVCVPKCLEGQLRVDDKCINPQSYTLYQGMKPEGNGWFVRNKTIDDLKMICNTTNECKGIFTDGIMYDILRPENEWKRVYENTPENAKKGFYLKV